MKQILALAFATVALAACTAAPQAQAGTGGEAASTSNLVPLSITTASGVRRFKVEVARTPEEQEKGLMFRTQMAADQGMIFPMSPPRVATFWMKNTVLPLDMVFVRADGTIARIAERTVPYSLDTVDSGEPVAAVLEINGGAAAAAGLAAGDKVSWPG